MTTETQEFESCPLCGRGQGFEIGQSSVSDVLKIVSLTRQFSGRVIDPARAIDIAIADYRLRLGELVEMKREM